MGHLPRKLHSTSSGTMSAPTGCKKKSINVHARIGTSATTPFSLSLAFATDWLSALRRKRATRELTPSTPRPQLGQPHPVETTVGVAKGNDEAEKYVMDNVRSNTPGGAGKSSSVDSDVFSGMERNEGMWYLKAR